MTHDEKCRKAGEKYAATAAEKLFGSAAAVPGASRILKRPELEAVVSDAFRAGFGEGLVDATRRVTCFDEEPGARR